MLQNIQDFVNESNQSNSNLDKLEVLKRYKGDVVVERALLYTYDTLRQFGVTSANCKKNAELTNDLYYDLFELLDDLSHRKITGHEAIASVNGFVSKNREYEDIIFNIIDRNLKTRSTASMINKVIPGLIPTFDVALASAYDEKTATKLDWEDEWFISRKLDGVRCLAVIDGLGEVTLYSRAGKEFDTLDVLKTALKELDLRNVVFDGEVCIVDEQGNENFAEIAKLIKRKDYTIEKPLYQIFDMLTYEEFFSKQSTRIFSERQTELAQTITDTQYYVLLSQWKGTDDFFSQMLSNSKKNGWEGLMLRKNVSYKGKRSQDILKVKDFSDAEYVVLDLISEPQRIIEAGEEVTREMLSCVVIEHKGNRVQVGSGFSKQQRKFYHENPEELIGKQITVQYFEESIDMHGNHSLRFPVVKFIYDENRDF